LETHIFNLQNTTFGFLIERRADLLIKKIYLCRDSNGVGPVVLDRYLNKDLIET
jgi:hypothetical protein